MGCEVECPVIPAARRIDWDIADPYGKDIETYRRTMALIKEKVTQLLEEID
jgi:arsenate reductase (thioredoxin)